MRQRFSKAGQIYGVLIYLYKYFFKNLCGGCRIADISLCLTNCTPTSIKRFMITLSSEVAEALADKKPVVALESTIIAHGMPYPDNVITALRVEQAVRDAGAIPATCAVMEGKLCAGLRASDLDNIGKKGSAFHKASRRDLAWLMAHSGNGATTVASTMMIAQMAGIRVFATGGIGGVHRGAGQTMDISADLQELAHTPVTVVCAGVKSILDIGLTLEYLETFGVPVIGFRTSDFPAFYAAKSGFSVDFQLDTPEAVAQMMDCHFRLPHAGGLLVANPAPVAFAQDAEVMEHVIQQSLALADQKGVQGKAITPFLLSAIQEKTGGESLKTNIELVCHNAQIAADIAIAFARINPL